MRSAPSFALVALAGTAVNAADSTCDPASLNTTSFNYINDVANQTVEEIVLKFNRGVCDIGRANLSESSSSSLCAPLNM